MSQVLDTLEVWVGEALCGQLEHVGNAKMRFHYTARYLEGQAPMALSQSLPLQESPFPHEQCSAFFGGLLPEYGVRDLIERTAHVSRDNDFALLKAIGGDCAGAVSFWEPGKHPASGPAEVQWLSPEELAAEVFRLPKRPLHVGSHGRVRLSLAGAQDKLPVVVDLTTDRVGLPLGDTPSTHVLKPDTTGFDGLAFNEAFCNAVARELGISVCDERLIAVGGQAALLVTRYDRRTTADGVQRLHQEDFCQALGISSRTKYEAEGGPGIAACGQLVRRAVRPPAPALAQLAMLIGCNDLIGNADAHAKNVSLLYGTQRTQLAPAYDLVSTAVYVDIESRYAMKIGGERRPDRIGTQHWKQFAHEMQLAPAQTLRLLADQARAIDAALDAARQKLADGGWHHPVLDRIADAVHARAQKRLAELS